MSTSTLSVATVMMAFPTATSVPSLTSISVTVPSVMVNPSLGSKISVATSAPLQQRADAVGDPGGVGNVRGLQHR